MNPCKTCGSSERYASGNCAPCSRLARQHYYARNRKKQIAAATAWKRANPDKNLRAALKWQRENRDKRRIITTRWRANNSEKIKTSTVARRLAAPWKWAAQVVARRCAKAARTPQWADLKKIRAIYAEAARIQSDTGRRMHVDHVIPLRGKLVCGLHIAENLRIVPAEVNWAKNNAF